MLGGIPSFSNSASAADCEDVDGATKTISADCQNLSITGDSPNVTIDSGVTIDSTAANAVATPDATNAIITNNGTISAATNRGFRTSGGDVQELINNGTITAAGGREGVRNAGTITTLTNAGTISADINKGINNRGDGTITTITNSGTISANDSSLWNAGTITTLTNSDTGTISATDEFGLKNVNGLIGTLNNSGTISAGDDYGLYNDGTSTITTLTNTGTISGIGNGIGIWNDSTSTITTLNNSQVNLTYKGKLPTNYNVIVNSATDYGKITFSSVSGSLNFGVHSTSTLTEGTYGSVISGLTSSNILSGTSGTYSNSNACADVDAAPVTFSSNCAELDISGDGSDITINSGVTISGVGDYDWTLNNSSGTTWDLLSTAQLDECLHPLIVFLFTI